MNDFDDYDDDLDAGLASTRCANAPCPRPADRGDDYCTPCGLERSLFTRRGGERDSGSYDRPGR